MARDTGTYESNMDGAAQQRRGVLGLSGADINRVLLYAILVTLILILGAVAYLVYAAVSPPKAPRTDIERRIYFYEQGVKAQPDKSELWEEYARALVDGGRYSKASEVIAAGLRKLEDRAGLLVIRAGLERLQGQDDRAIKTADEAIKAVAAFRASEAKKALAKGLGAPQAASMDIVNAEILKAEIFAERGDAKAAVEAYTRALAESPRMSDVLAARGDLYLKSGDEEAARKDFLEALRYDPESTTAAEGLKKLGETTP